MAPDCDAERNKPILGREGEWRSTALYGFAHLGKSLFWYSSEILFAYFLTDLAGLSSGQMGIILASGFLVSAAIDLSIGVFLQRWLISARAAARLQLLGAILCSGTLLAVFIGAWIPLEWRFAYAVAAGIGFRLAFAAYDIPQNALMALGTEDRVSRLRIASTRIWFSGAAILIVALAVGPVVALRGSSGGPWFLVLLAGVFTVVAIATAWRLAAALPNPEPLGAPAAIPTLGHVPVAGFVLLLALMVVTSAFTQAFGKLEPYYATYTLRSAWWGGAVIVLMALGIVVGQPLWLALCKRAPKPVVLLLGAAIQIVALVAFWRVGTSSPQIAAAAAWLFGLGNGAVGMAQWAAFSDAVAARPPARAGPSYGLFAASAKIGLAGGSVLLASLLDSPSVSPLMSERLVTLMAGVPAIGAIIIAGIALALWRSSDR